MRRSWITSAAIGLVSVIVGVALLVNIDEGVAALHWLIVVALGLAAADAFATTSSSRRPWGSRLAGVLYLVGAAVGLVWPHLTLRVVALTAGISFLVAGGVQAGAAWTLRGRSRSWGWGFTLGLLSVLGGLVFLLANPLFSVSILVVVFCCHLISSGVTLMAVAFRLRRADVTAQAIDG